MRPIAWIPLLAWALCACSTGRATPLTPGDGVTRCRYDVSVARRRPLTLNVHAACEGRGITGVAASGPALLAGLGAVRSSGGRLERRALNFELPRRRREASFGYSIDLDAIALRSGSFDTAHRSGASLIAPVSTFLLHPLPLDVGTEIELSVRTPAAFEFTTGLQRHGSGYRLQAHEIPVATYALFGRFARREITLGLGARRATVELAIAEGKLSVSNDTLTSWLRRRAEAVAAFYGVFPAERALVTVLPVPGSGVRFGKVLPESAPGILLLVGSEATEGDLHADWILIHELFHLGVPSFYEEGKWFDEGLATYFEPILRARTGMLSELELWREFARGFPLGLHALTRDGLERARGYRGLYWGGALYCLLADIAIRRDSDGRLGLEDGLRRVHSAGGHASEVWPLRRTLETADLAFTRPVLEPLARRHAQQPSPVDLEAIFDELGVVVDGGAVRLDDEAPLAWVRRALLRGAAAVR